VFLQPKGIAVRKKRISHKSLHNFSKKHLGYSSKPGVSIYKIASDALDVAGYPKPGNRTFKKHVKEHCEIIEMQAKTLDKKKFITPPKVEKKKNSHSGVSPSSNSFLKSYEWRKLRMVVLKKYGPKCQCCGATTKDGETMNVDHIKPRKNYPELALDINNLQVLCSSCNHGKGNWDETDWRAAPTNECDHSNNGKNTYRRIRRVDMQEFERQKQHIDSI
jgi:5-methylcytosine-specific restriction endonuclease McrA